MTHRWQALTVSAVICLGVVSLLPTDALAKKGGGGYGGGRGGGNYNSGPSQADIQREQQQRAAYQAHMQQVAAAQSDVNAAQQKLDEVITKYRVEYEKTPEWTQAQEELAKAQTAYEDSKKPVLEAVHKQQDYQDAIAAKEKIAADLDAARKSEGQVDSQKMTDLATQQMAAGAVASHLEAAACDADPGVKDAKAKMLAASASVQALHRKFLESLKGDADYVSAKAAVDDAHAKLVAARGGKATTATASGSAATPAGKATAAGDQASPNDASASKTGSKTSDSGGDN